MIYSISCTDVAALMLDLCTEPDTEHPSSSKEYKVTLYYGILEDFPDGQDVSSSRSRQGGKSSFYKYEGDDYADDASFMFPKKFDYKHHPLNLIVSV